MAVARQRRSAPRAGGARLRRARVELTLPAFPDVFVGRERELEELGARLRDGARLLTLVGAPGTGKTRLALRLAERAVEAGTFPAAAFADLTPVRDAAGIVRTLAEQLGVSIPGRTDVASASAALALAVARWGPLLVVLDNFEQVVADAPLVAEWLLRAPSLSVIVTSRERLRIAGELPHELEPLAVPDAAADPATVLAAPAVRLLLARTPGYQPRDTDLEHLAAIAQRLEGLPLALELAASRLSLLGAAALRERLSSSLDALGPGRRGAPSRQATLRGALEWSWALLDDAERRALACLALFRGSFSVEAAIATIAPTSAALDVLQSLREKSLVARAGAGERLHLFESIREHARERLDDPDAPLRMARFFVAESASRIDQLSTRHGRVALAWLVAERTCLVAAHDALVELGSPVALELRADLLLALDRVVQRVGPGGTHLTRIDTLLETRLEPTRLARLLLARARVRRDLGDVSACIADLERARAQLAGAERRAVGAELGEAWLLQGGFDEAERVLRGALEDALAARDASTELRARAGLGLVHHGRGRLDEAEAEYVRALDLATELGDALAEARARRDLGTLCLQRGRPERARAHYEAALARSPGDDLRLEGVVRGNLAILEQERGALDDALAHLKRALACLKAVGDLPFQAHVLGYLGAVHHERGQLDAARDAYGRALEILSDVRDVRLEGIFLAARAVALAAGGRPGEAWNDLEIAARRLQQVGDPALLATLELHRAAVGLHDASGPRVADEALASATRAAHRALEGAAPHAGASDDVRFARRLLTRAMPADGLEVGPKARNFVVPGRSPVDLSSRPTLARVLDCLVDARLAHPGEPVPVATLVDAGWPGERIMPLAAQNRLRVTLSTLRGLGLKGLLKPSEGGYLLDPTVPVTRVP